jgi:hypothetical protein
VKLTNYQGISDLFVCILTTFYDLRIIISNTEPTQPIYNVGTKDVGTNTKDGSDKPEH